MRQILTSFILAVLFLSPSFSDTPPAAQRQKKLDPQYKNWLNLVSYIITKDEKDIFLQLTNNQDRELFINFFWQKRDPVPSTTENEYKTEIEKRFRYVNKHFKRGSPKPGWMTDMGKFYMILGEPSSIETFDSQPGLYPARVWYYYGDKELGLPAYFNITFFKRNGMGEWVLYDPASDGPAALIPSNSAMDAGDYRQLYKYIQKLAPSLAGPSLSMMAGQRSSGYYPSPRNFIVMTNILKSPHKKVETTYAKNFLKYRGFVEVESSVNFFETSHMTALIKKPGYDYHFVYFSVKPKNISVEYIQAKDKYYFNFKLVVGLKKMEKEIYQYSKNYEYYIDKNQLDTLKSSGIIIHDYFPVIPGRYQMTVFIKNTVKQEFSYFDENLVVPAGTPRARLAEPILGYKKESLPNEFVYPYKFKNFKLSIDTDKIFGINEVPYFLIGIYDLDQKTWEKGYVVWELTGSDRHNFFKNGKILLRDHLFLKNQNLIAKFPLTDLRSDYYQLTLSLFDHNGVITDIKNSDFSISPFGQIPRPTEIYSRTLGENNFYHHYIAGQQYLGTGDYSMAETYLEKAMAANPGFHEATIATINLALTQEKYHMALKAADRLASDHKMAFNYHVFKGKAWFGLEKYPEALDEFLAANKLNDSQYHLINMIGMTFLKLGNRSEAKKAFDSSLKINAEQPDIKEKIKNLTDMN